MRNVYGSRGGKGETIRTGNIVNPLDWFEIRSPVDLNKGEPLERRTVAHPPSMEQMFLLVYNELHQLAARKLRGERDGHTLSTTALVNEAWIELNKLNRIQWQNRGHFLAVAAQAMRRILI